MERSAVFLQVRLASTRLPGKALFELGGKPVIVHAMEALRPLAVDCHVIVTDEESAPVLTPLARSLGFDVYPGHPEDVLERFVAAGRAYRVETVVRATGDNPLVSRIVAEAALELFHETDADYAGITGTPLGTGVEVLRASALRRVARDSADRYDREHVGPGLYRNPEAFRIETRPAPAEWSGSTIRVTLDTEDDYARLRELYAHHYRGVPIEVNDLVRAVRCDQQHSA